MPASFSSRSKRIISYFLGLLLIKAAYAQPIQLEPIRTALPSKSVRAIHRDKRGFLWIGTDMGIEANLPSTSKLRNIEKLLQQKSVWAIESTDSLLMVGSRLNGFYLFNLFNGSLIRHFDSSVINQIRRIRVVQNKIFVLTNNGPFLLRDTCLFKIQNTKSIEGGFLMDVFEYKDKVYAAHYNPSTFLEFVSNRFERVKSFRYPFGDNFHTAFRALQIHDSIAFCSGGFSGFLSFLSSSGKVKQIKDDDLLLNGMAAWDMVFRGDEVWIVVGNVNTNNEGYLVHFNLRTGLYSKIKTDYLQCIFYDTLSNTLLLGSQNSGVFSIPFQISEFPLSVSRSRNEMQVFLGKSQRVITKYLENQYWTFGSVQFDFFNIEKGIEFHYPKSNHIYPVAKIERIKDTLFLFETYGQIKYFNGNDFKPYNNSYTTIPIVVKTENEIFVLNKERDFISIGPSGIITYNLEDKSLLFAEDFAIVGSELYLLSQNQVKKYTIDFKRKLIRRNEPITPYHQTEGFVPHYILNWKSRLLLLGENGCLEVDRNSLLPFRFIDFGSYLLQEKPLLFEDLVLQISDYGLLRFDSLVETRSSDDEFTVDGLAQSYKTGEQISMSFHKKGWQARRWLKRIEVYLGDKLKFSFFTINNQAAFDSMLASGDYRIVVSGMEGKQQFDFEVEHSTTAKLLFWIALIVLLIALIAATRLFVLRRKYTRKNEENRLELLKHQLNPHFVYNSLNLISALVVENRNEEAVQAIADFAKLQRAFLETNGKNSHSLAEELAFLKIYVEIFKRRFSDSSAIRFELRINPLVPLEDISLPPLLLQPIIENAFKYGVDGNKEAFISISIENQLGNSINVTVLNYIHLESESDSVRYGVKNIQERIKAYNWLHGECIRCHISNNDRTFKVELIFDIE